MSNPLDPHQLEALRAAYAACLGNVPGFYLAHAPGTGKTLTGIAFIRLTQTRHTLVVTNVAGYGVWQRELEKWWAPDQWQRIGGHWERPIALTTYDHIKRDPGDLNWLRANPPDLIIFDESHKIKSPSSQRSKLWAKVAGLAGFRLLMSGTPAHSPLDWWAQYRFIDPINPRWSQTFTHYKQQIAYFGGPHNQWVSGFREDVVAQVREEMAPFTHVATTDVLHLEEPRETIVPVILSAPERAAYRRLEKELVYESEQGGVVSIKSPMHKPMRLHQVTSGWLTTDPEDEFGERRLIELGHAKLEVLDDLLEERAGEHVLISAYFRHDLDVIQDYLAKHHKHRCVYRIDGSTSAYTRAQCQDGFQASQTPDIMLIQQLAGGEAITLTASRTLIVYSWAPSVIGLQQLIGRIFRKGQTRATEILVLAGSKNDEHMWRGLRLGLEGVSLARMLIEQLRRSS